MLTEKLGHLYIVVCVIVGVPWAASLALKNLRSGLRPTSSGFILSANDIITSNRNSLNPHICWGGDHYIYGANQNYASPLRFSKHAKQQQLGHCIVKLKKKMCMFTQTIQANSSWVTNWGVGCRTTLQDLRKLCATFSSRWTGSYSYIPIRITHTHTRAEECRGWTCSSKTIPV